MENLKYNFLDDNFTVFENVETPKIELDFPTLSSPIDISDWATGFSSSGTPIVKDNRPKSYMIVNNSPEVQLNEETTNTSEKRKKKLNGNKEIAFNFFKSKGLSDIAVAGILGNLMVESGDENLTKTDSIGDKKLGAKQSAYGLAQWRLDRKTDLKNFASKQGKPMSDFLTQLNFIWEEINGSQRGYKILEGLSKARTVEEATINFMNTYERPNSDPKINAISKRIKYAKSCLQ